MLSELAGIRARLIARWEAIPDSPPAELVERLCAEAWGLVQLIGWIDEHPDGSMPKYRHELARVKHEARVDTRGEEE